MENYSIGSPSPIFLVQESEAQKSSGDAVDPSTCRSSDSPPTIPPLPQGHLQALQNRTPERGGTVAKIVSQFQDTPTSCNVIRCFTLVLSLAFIHYCFCLIFAPTKTKMLLDYSWIRSCSSILCLLKLLKESGII